MSDQQQMRQILAELRGFDKDKRRTAVMKLGMHGGDDAVRALIMTVRNDHEDLITRGRAALMLGKLRDLRAVEPLIKALTAPGYKTPIYAAEALGEIGDSRAIQSLLKLSANATGDLLGAVQTALAKLGYLGETHPEPA